MMSLLSKLCPYLLQIDQLEKCSLAVEGMTCSSCVEYIERNIAKLDGRVGIYHNPLKF